MSVDYWLFRASTEQDIDKTEELLPFGSQEEIIERLCSMPGFELRSKKPLPNIGAWAIITYIYPQKNDMGRDVEFAFSDPVECISINRSYREDFLPVIAILSDLSPFEIGDLDGDMVNPEELFYSLDD